MALKIIGSGLGRTGTKSLQTALETLGFGPCHHMTEVFAHADCLPLWIAAGVGKPDWDAIFADYQAAVDYPSAHYWRQIADHYPEAKVIHTQRDPDIWFDSTQATIFAPDSLALRHGPLRDFFVSFMKDFGDRLHERTFMTDYFRRHNEAVKNAIAPERLLILEPGQGWEPLCAFLGVPVPDVSYPAQNSRAAFIGRVKSPLTAGL